MTLDSASTRYAVLLVPEPAFTGRAYRARQIICGQYGSWAAEMLMVHLMLSPFFPCSDDRLPELTTGLAAVASDSRDATSGFPMSHRGVASVEDAPGTIFLDFTPQEPDHPLLTLHASVTDLVNRVADGPNDAAGVETGTGIYLPLMQYARSHGNYFRGCGGVRQVRGREPGDSERDQRLAFDAGPVSVPVRR